MKWFGFPITIVRSVTILGLTVLAGSSALAQEAELDGGAGIEEIMVTAQKRAQSQQDVPLSVTAYTQQFLDDTRIYDIEKLVPFVPGLTGNDIGLGGPVYAIRGISSNSFGIGGEMSVGVFLDEGYIGRNKTSGIAFMDVARVEVLRGPQSTLFGRNSSAGAISIISNRPEDEIYGRAQLVAGNLGKLAALGTLNVPIIPEKLFVRGTVMGDWRNGHTLDLANDLEDFDNVDVFAGKAAIRVIPHPRVDATVTYLGQHDQQNGVAYKNAYDLDTDPGTPGIQGLPDAFGVGGDPFNGKLARDVGSTDASDRTLHDINARIFWDITDDITMTSITTFNRYNFDSWTDVDATENPLMSVHIRDESSDTIGQEFRFNGYWREIDWMVGVSLFHEDISTSHDYDWNEIFIGISTGPIPPPPAPPAFANACDPAFSFVFAGGVPCAFSTQDTVEQRGTYNSYAIYGDATWAVMDRLNLTVGLRYSYDAKSFSYEALAPVSPVRMVFGGLTEPANILGFATAGWVDEYEAWDLPQPRFAIDYKITDDMMFYGSISRGFKSGGFDPTGADSTVFDPEDVWAYEAGVKASGWGHRVIFNVAGYYNDYRDFQLQTLDGATIVTRNASDVTTYGIESELIVEPINDWRTYFSGAWNVSTFDDFVEDVTPPGLPPGTVIADFSGNTLPRAPQGTFATVSQYDIGLGLGLKTRLQLEAAYSSKVYFSQHNTEIESQDGYWLLNARVGLADVNDVWRVTGFVENFLDTDYLVDTRDVSFGHIRTRGTPRLYGIEIIAELHGLPGWLKL